jgi:hypothetical protein
MASSIFRRTVGSIAQDGAIQEDVGRLDAKKPPDRVRQTEPNRRRFRKAA